MEYKVNTLFGRVGQDLAGFALQIDGHHTAKITDTTNLNCQKKYISQGEIA